MPLKKAFAAVAVCFVLAALAASLLRASELRRERDALSSAAADGFREAYAELTGALGELETSLTKLLVAEAPRTLALSLDDVWRGSGAIAALMGRLPIPHPDAAELSELLARTGDYCRMLSASVLSGGTLSEEERAKLGELARFGADVRALFEARIASGDLPEEARTNDDFYNEDGSFSGDGLTLPELEYDGPMSRSAAEREPRGLTGEALSEEACLEKARALLPLLLGGGAELTPEGRGGGRIPFYGFSGEKDGRRFFIAVTETGGALLSFELEEGGEGGEADADALEEKAAALLERLGCGGAEAVSRQYYGGAVLFGFACTADCGGETVLLAGDLVRVRLGADGVPTLIDASAMLMNHCERSFPEGLLSREDAAGSLSPRLAAGEARLALIPLDDLTERLCWEFSGTAGEAGYLVYIDAVTGEEVRILRFIDDENGTKTL